MADYSEWTLRQLTEERDAIQRIIDREQKTVDELNRRIALKELVEQSSNGGKKESAITT